MEIKGTATPVLTVNDGYLPRIVGDTEIQTAVMQTGYRLDPPIQHTLYLDDGEEVRDVEYAVVSSIVCEQSPYGSKRYEPETVIMYYGDKDFTDFLGYGTGTRYMFSHVEYLLGLGYEIVRS